MNKNNPPQQKPLEREMPTVYRHLLKSDSRRTFTWKERLQILFGCGLVMAIRIPCQWNPGKYTPVCVDQVTTAREPDAGMKAQLEQILIEQPVKIK